jgi:pantothenate kinase
MVDGVGNQITGFDPSRPATSATTSVAQNVVSVSLLAANANRRQWMVYNAGTKNLLVAFAATATLSVYVMQIPPNGFYESPENGYTGVISGIWAGAGGGSAKVTEITT